MALCYIVNPVQVISITFIKRLDETLIQQFLGKKPLISSEFKFKLVGKIGIEESRALVVNIIANYGCTRVLQYAKMLKEAKIKETICVFVTFLTLVTF